MSIRAGTFLHDAQGFVLDRVQTGGVSNLNIAKTTIYELGDYNTVGNIFDIPDLSFDVTSTDVSCDIEALLHGIQPNAVTAGQAFTFQTTYPIDIISPFRSGNGAFNIIKGIDVPYLTLDTVSYNFGVKANAEESFTLRGDSLYYIPGSPYYQKINLSAGVFTYAITNAALPYTESGNTYHILSACVKNVGTGVFQRLFAATDGSATGYTDTASNITLNTDWWGQGYSSLHVTYGSAVATTYLQNVNATTATKPAAIRSKDILLYVAPQNAATPTYVKWSGVQSFKLTRKVNLTNTEEFGNTHYVSSTYDTADVSGEVVVRAADINALFTLIQQVTGTDNTKVSGALSQPLFDLELRVRDPATGVILKTWNIPDAQFTLPTSQGKANTDLDVTFPFFSSQGLLNVFKGATSV